ncbi:MAG: type II secretion system protein GspD [Chitinivibrionales bacterium]|nr:type II secretion system protein GspD [Chitinivibrionales bacterium]
MKTKNEETAAVGRYGFLREDMMRPGKSFFICCSTILPLIGLTALWSVALCQPTKDVSAQSDKNIGKQTGATAPADIQKMSFDVKDTDISDVIRMISKGYNLNIILDREITGKVTLHLSDAPILEGLNTLAQSNGWELVKEGSVYRIRKPVAEKKSSIFYSQDKLTVDVSNVDVMEFIKELSAKSAISIVADTKINGKISGKLYHVSLEDGLKALLQANGFKVTKIKNIYRVSQADVSGPSSTSTGFPGARQSSKSGSPDFSVECTDGLLSMNVTNAQLDDIINAISEQSDVEIIIYGKLTGDAINAKLNKVPLIQGLALLLSGSRFTFVQKNKVILIGDRNPATPSGQTLSKSELVHLRYIKADIIPTILPKNIPINNIKIIKEQNALLISGTSEDIVSTIDFLRTVDIPTPQVVIDVLVVEYTRKIDKDFSFEAGGNKSSGKNNSFSFPRLEINRYGLDAKYTLKKIVDFFDVKTSVIDRLPDDFFFQLRLLEQEDKAKLLAHPSITVLNGNKAKIDVGETSYYQVRGGTTENPTWDFRPINTGISLNITPWISRSGQITAEIIPEVSNVIRINADSKYPDISRRQCLTTVCIDNGKTLVLGGLLRSEDKMSHQKVPFLGDLPIIGAIFRTNQSLKIQTNLVIYITPHVIDKSGYVDLKEEMKKFNMKERKGEFEDTFEDTLSISKRVDSTGTADMLRTPVIRSTDSTARDQTTDSLNQPTGQNESVAPAKKESRVSRTPGALPSAQRPAQGLQPGMNVRDTRGNAIEEMDNPAVRIPPSDNDSPQQRDQPPFSLVDTTHPDVPFPGEIFDQEPVQGIEPGQDQENDDE